MEIRKILTRKLSTKTFIISHLFIFFLGLLFIFSMSYFISHGLSVKNNWDDRLPVTSKPKSYTLELTSPDDNVLTYDSALIISGKTSPLSLILISLSDEDLVISPQDSGEFTKVVNLNPGLNELTISSFDETGSSKSEIRSIFYTKDQI